MKHFILDTNVLIRFLMQDNAAQGAAAEALFKKAAKEEVTLYLNSAIIAEAVFILLRHYDRPRLNIAKALLGVINATGVKAIDGDIIAGALERFAGTNIDFPDALLAAWAAHSSYTIASFDRDFDKFKDIKRVEPKA